MFVCQGKKYPWTFNIYWKCLICLMWLVFLFITIDKLEISLRICIHLENSLIVKHAFRSYVFQKNNTEREGTFVNIRYLVQKILLSFYFIFGIFNIFNKHIKICDSQLQNSLDSEELLRYFFIVVPSLHKNSNIEHSQKVIALNHCKYCGLNWPKFERNLSLYCEAIEIEY